MIYCFDIDGTICTPTSYGTYEKATPYPDVVDRINSLYDSGNTIKLMTGRGCVSKIDYTELTSRQLESWGVKYHELIMGRKPHADLFIDDRGVGVESWMQGYSKLPGYKPIRGIVAGAFDIIHPGYIEMFKMAKINCTHLTVALHEDPSVERGKLTPVQSVEDRQLILESIRYVDSVITYKTEEDLKKILYNGEFDKRFLGEDYIEKEVTAPGALPIFWVHRRNNISTTSVKEKIFKSIQDRRIND